MPRYAQQKVLCFVLLNNKTLYLVILVFRYAQHKLNKVINYFISLDIPFNLCYNRDTEWRKYYG